MIGSIHFIGDRSLDTEEYTIWDERSDPDEIWRRYFETLAAAARSGLFDVLAHPDLIKVWGRARTLPSRDLRFYYEPAVEAIAESGVAVEVSTAGLRKATGEIYPARLHGDVRRGRCGFRALLRRPRAGQLGFEYPQALEFLEAHGVGEIAVFEGRQRRLEPVGEVARCR